MPGGRPPKPTALHLLHGTFRRDRHGKRPDAPKNFGHVAMKLLQPDAPDLTPFPDGTAPAIDAAEAERRLELKAWLKRLHGEPA